MFYFSWYTCQWSTGAPAPTEIGTSGLTPAPAKIVNFAGDLAGDFWYGNQIMICPMIGIFIAFWIVKQQYVEKLLKN